MMKPDDISPRARNHFREDEYFSLNVRSGVIRNVSGTRVLTIPEEFIAGLHAGLADETGGAAPIVLYECGKWWGKQFAKRHASEMRQLYASEAGELPYHFFEQVLRRVWALHGWGVVDVSFDLRDRGFVVVNVQNAFYSDIVGNIGRTSDHLIAGLLASILSDISGRDLSCVEIACRSKGDAKCSFLVGVEARTSSVAAWVSQGRSRSDILAELATGNV